jgi:type IV pilus assembly protein PilN
MIRINLLAVRRKAPEPNRFAVQKVPLLCSLILLATALLVGWRFWSARQLDARLGDEIQRAEQEAQSLRTVLQQVQQFEQRKAQLQQRVALIEELRQGQSAPVHMLDEISRAVPDRLWLTELKQDPQGLKIDGRTTSLTSLSDFVGNLEASGYFARPVEILDSQVETSNNAVDLVKFSVKAQFTMPGAARAVPAKAGT